MSSEYGKNLRISIFGQSHSKGIGVVIDGIPAGERFDMEEVLRFMQRRAPGGKAFSTARKETRSGRFRWTPRCRFCTGRTGRTERFRVSSSLPAFRSSDAECCRQHCVWTRRFPTVLYRMRG